MGNEAGVAILGALLNGCTQHLDMSYTALRGVAAGRAIGRMLRCHTIALKFFNVEHNALGREGINEVLLKNKTYARKNEKEEAFDPSIYAGGMHDVMRRMMKSSGDSMRCNTMVSHRWGVNPRILLPASAINRRVITDAVDLPLADRSSIILGMHIRYWKVDEAGYYV